MTQERERTGPARGDASGRRASDRAIGGADRWLQAIAPTDGRRARLTHVERIPARSAREVDWPSWADPAVVAAFAGQGIHRPWSHQAEVAEHVRAGRHAVVATGTASGKSLGYLLPVLTGLLEGAASTDPRTPGRGATALYLAPTKALAADQLRALRALDVPGVRVGPYDGDTGAEDRDWVRRHGHYVLTNPDMVHRSMLPGHRRWAGFWRALSYVVVDEMHAYRGVFGAHVSCVLRRVRRVARWYGAEPVFVLASATVAEPGEAAGRLVGATVAAVAEDGGPRAASAFALWEPPLTDSIGEQGAPVRRGALTESADLMADLVAAGAHVLCFARSRRGAEAAAQIAAGALEEVEPGLGRRVAAYRSGYLPEERRDVEARLQSGDLLGVAATTALELGVDVGGLDAVVMAGWPGTRASMWQQAGRAGRAGQEALAVLVARDDPLDTYLVGHPEAVFGLPVEASVFDPDNPYVLGPHLAAAAAELPLREAELGDFGPEARAVVETLAAEGMLRARRDGWYWTRRDRAADLADLRGIGGRPVSLVESGTGRLLGTVDDGSADRMVHAGAVYVHQGQTYVVEALDLGEAVALLRADRPDWTTTAREVSDLRVVGERAAREFGAGRVAVGEVEVTRRVVGYLRRRLATGEVLGEEPLDLPERRLRTVAVWWTAGPEVLAAAGLSPSDVPGAAHAAEHAAIGLLPLLATCDRWDIGGLSTAWHADTGLATVFVYDGQPGGAGFSQRGYERAEEWWRATREAIAGCGCERGCPSCVQSPKCGNGNDPLDKAGALALLGALLPC